MKHLGGGLAPTWKSSKQEVSQAFQTQCLKHEVQMASKSSYVALLIFEIIPRGAKFGATFLLIRV